MQSLVEYVLPNTRHSEHLSFRTLVIPNICLSVRTCRETYYYHILPRFGWYTHPLNPCAIAGVLKQFEKNLIRKILLPRLSVCLFECLSIFCWSICLIECMYTLSSVFILHYPKGEPNGRQSRPICEYLYI